MIFSLFPLIDRLQELMLDFADLQAKAGEASGREVYDKCEELLTRVPNKSEFFLSSKIISHFS